MQSVIQIKRNRQSQNGWRGMRKRLAQDIKAITKIAFKPVSNVTLDGVGETTHCRDSEWVLAPKPLLRRLLQIHKTEMTMVDHQPDKLTIYLGYAAAVGKTFVMLEEAYKRQTYGADIVIGYFEPHSRKETIAKAEGLEMVPRRDISYHGAVLPEMDTDAVLARQPEICIVDELPHSNVPGSKHAKRWQDIEELLANGIEVWTSMNIQHLESLNEQVWRITGIRVHETVPDRILQQAHRLVLVDITPKSLLARLQEGTIFDRNQVQRAFQHFFREPALAALRELALRQLESGVESRIVNTDELAPHNSLTPRR